jgi:hypothetical protein
MALTRRLDQIVDAIQRTADVVAFTDKHPVSYVKDLACRGIAALLRVTATTDTEFRPVGSFAYTTDGIASTQPLPVDMRSILAVEYTVDGYKSFLEPYEWAERPMLTQTVDTPRTGRALAFKRIGTNIELLPKPDVGHTVQIWYATTASQPSADSDTVDVYDRLDDYIIWWAAREIAQERENWQRFDRLTGLISNLEADIRVLARSRDLSSPTRIANRRDLRTRSPRGWPR